MNTELQIDELRYSSGLVRMLKDRAEVPQYSVEPSDVTDEVRNLIREAGLDGEHRSWGDPFLCSPIQMDALSIRVSDDVALALCFNRAMCLVGDPTPEMLAFHRLCVLLDEITGNRLTLVEGLGKRNPKENTRKLRQLASRKPKGFPVALIDYFGPSDRRAELVTIAVWEDPENESVREYSRSADSGDARFDEDINTTLVDMIGYHTVASVFLSRGIVGCPHRPEVEDGDECPECEFWKGRDGAAPAISRLSLYDITEDPSELG